MIKLEIKDDITLVNVPDTTHHDYLLPESPAWKALIEAIKKMLPVNK